MHFPQNVSWAFLIIGLLECTMWTSQTCFRPKRLHHAHSYRTGPPSISGQLLISLVVMSSQAHPRRLKMAAGQTEFPHTLLQLIVCRLQRMENARPQHALLVKIDELHRRKKMAGDGKTLYTFEQSKVDLLTVRCMSNCPCQDKAFIGKQIQS
jgi:hypothetical protein